MFNPRPLQAEVLRYQGGKMAVLAVPGSGKTQTLSFLAASLISSGQIRDDQEILVVTLVNSAVNNFSSRVAGFIRQAGLLPNMGYRVRTLHGLAHDIVRERPSLVGLEANFQIVDERTSDEILADVVDTWVHSHQDFAELFLNLDMDERRLEGIRREKWPYLVRDLARNLIKTAKDLQATPGIMQDRLNAINLPLPLVQMGMEIYTGYQRALAYRGAVDFDDLIRLALRALVLDEEYLQRLRNRWPFILEDEAQDSSLIQEAILRKLVGDEGNWVRVGDPNQSIFETFTTASPKYLRNFCRENLVVTRELRESGRSGQPIIGLANFLIEWCKTGHPVQSVRTSLDVPYIYGTGPGDPQPNPPAGLCSIELVRKKLSPQEEQAYLVNSLSAWLPDHPESTVAVLVPRNDRGEELVGLLKGKNIPCVELLRSTRGTRETAGALGNILKCLAEPTSPQRLATAYKVYRRVYRDRPEAKAILERGVRTLSKCGHTEGFIHPFAGADWLADQNLVDADPQVFEELLAFRPVLQGWHKAVLLPIDQLLLTIAQDLFTEAADLALSDKLAGLLHSSANEHPEWGIAELSDELAEVARNERKFLGFSDEETGFEPDRYRGKVVVATIHKAKGLEWDRVYLTSVNNYDFPSAQSHDQFISEKWFIRDRLNLEAEALSQITGLLQNDLGKLYSPEKTATLEARESYAAERLRLLYVGITRARKELVITWNTGRNGDLQPATPLIAMLEYWKEIVEHA